LRRSDRQHAEDVAQVELRIELVQARGGDQREQVTGGLTVIITADKQPGLSAQAMFHLPSLARGSR
jgi:hypothetical protein